MTAVPLEKIGNFRDLGGHRTREGRRVRTGRIFRSGHLAAATDADLETLAGLGVRVVVDFRGPGDTEAEGQDRLPAGAEHVQLPMFDPSPKEDIRAIFSTGDPQVMQDRFGDGQGFEMMRRGAASLVTHPERCEQFGVMVRRLAAPDGTPALIHCSAGKDRTGWAASLMLLALGVDEDDVIAHYLESNNHRPVLTRDGGRSPIGGFDMSLLEPFLAVHEDYARASLDALEAGWGGIDGYLRDGLCLDDELLARFRQVMLED